MQLLHNGTVGTGRGKACIEFRVKKGIVCSCERKKNTAIILFSTFVFCLASIICPGNFWPMVV